MINITVTIQLFCPKASRRAAFRLISPPTGKEALPVEYANLVSRIVAAEESAREIAKEAQVRESSLEQDLEQEIARMRESYMARARHRVEEVEKTEAQAAEEDLANWDRKLTQAMSAVEASYARNKDAWVETLFQRIVGGAS